MFCRYAREGEENHSSRRHMRITESGLHAQLCLDQCTTLWVCHCFQPHHSGFCHHSGHHHHQHHLQACNHQGLLSEMNYYCDIWKAFGYFKLTSRIILNYMDLCVVTCIINSIKDTDLAACDTYRIAQGTQERP